ncbi:MAG: carbohydrate ABC transporter permease [Ancalomicrobiaceae bacterium]|nr:carbohydrate ABC transporter permease [Ancalomicrobiaceae bacterium]
MPLTPSPRTIKTAVLTVLAGIWLVPVLMMLAVALMPPGQRAAGFGGLAIKGVSLASFGTAFDRAPILLHFVNSLIITVTSVVLVVVISSLAAYAFARTRFRGGESLFYGLLATLMLPIPALIVPIFQLNKTFGLLDTYWGLILPYTALGVPFAVIIYRSFFSAIPQELEEAAKIDGCSTFGIWLRIIMPLSWPATSVVVIFQFMTSFNEFILALVTMDSNSLKPLTLVPLIYAGPFMAQPGPMFATLTLITIPVVVVYLLMQRFMIGGLTAGAVKG